MNPDHWEWRKAAGLTWHVVPLVAWALACRVGRGYQNGDDTVDKAPTLVIVPCTPQLSTLSSIHAPRNSLCNFLPPPPALHVCQCPPGGQMSQTQAPTAGKYANCIPKNNIHIIHNT